MSQATGPDDRQVEEKLREILEPFDRRLEQVSTVMAVALVVVVPATFLGLWLPLEMMAKRALGWAAGAFGVLVVVGISWDWLMARLACRHFDRCFPHDSPMRAAAIRILAEMETPSKAAERLRESLARSSPARIVRHHAENEPPPPLPAESSPSPTALPPPVPEPNRRPGGYYDYIPLEPRAHDPEKPGGAG